MVDEQVVAFAHATPTAVPDTAEITGFYCHPAAWGTGIAVALMTRTNDELAKHFSNVILWTARDAARARRFYEKVGFQLTGNTRDEPLTNWTTGEAAECMIVEYTTSLAR
jgi:predicted GNAT family acetyltransferase